MEQTSKFTGVLFALVSAVLFGASTPFAKLLLNGQLNPWLLAGLLYLGSGVGLGIWTVARSLSGVAKSEAGLSRTDLPWLALVVLSGGVAAPVLLMIGLSTTAASTAALLLNLEGLATMAIAWIVFRENVDRRLLLGAAVILAGAVVLSWQSGTQGVGTASLCIAGACFAWGVDNNLTRKLSAADPVQIAMIKGLAAGLTNLFLALLLGAHLPSLTNTASAAIIGFFGYGVSLALFVIGLRYLGTARTGAYFSTAPFAGALLAVVMLDEPLTARLVVAGLLMALGVYLHLTETHAHLHTHDAMEHEHAHIHDAHHQHAHTPDDPLGEPHVHRHRHTPLMHAHDHYPDLHHRHGHT